MRELLATDTDVLTDRPGRTITADKGYVSSGLDRWAHRHGLRLLRPSHHNRPPPPPPPAGSCSRLSARWSSR